MSKDEDGHVSFSSLILSSCRVYGRERPVWSCGVVEWIGRPLISPTPSPGHRLVTLPFNHFYQACSCPGLREVPVDTFQLSGSRKICISFGNLEDENGKKPKVEGTPTVGSISKKMRFVPGDSLQLPVPGGKLWMGTKETLLLS